MVTAFDLVAALDELADKSVVTRIAEAERLLAQRLPTVTAPPTPAEVATARAAAGLTMEAAAALVHRNTYKRWSEWETGARPMPLAEWELFLFKVVDKTVNNK